MSAAASGTLGASSTGKSGSGGAPSAVAANCKRQRTACRPIFHAPTLDLRKRLQTADTASIASTAMAVGTSKAAEAGCRSEEPSMFDRGRRLGGNDVSESGPHRRSKAQMACAVRSTAVMDTCPGATNNASATWALSPWHCSNSRRRNMSTETTTKSQNWKRRGSASSESHKSKQSLNANPARVHSATPNLAVGIVSKLCALKNRATAGSYDARRPCAREARSKSSDPPPRPALPSSSSNATKQQKASASASSSCPSEPAAVAPPNCAKRSNAATSQKPRGNEGCAPRRAMAMAMAWTDSATPVCCKTGSLDHEAGKAARLALALARKCADKASSVTRVRSQYSARSTASLSTFKPNKRFHNIGRKASWWNPRNASARSPSREAAASPAESSSPRTAAARCATKAASLTQGSSEPATCRVKSSSDRLAA
mmetsp:Transcript_117024/g.338279  ORF Transcript_117024/g.338279 Transcript_117024/m.338279 type:complete len:429 (-) Transcript_117024:890-2176(-)